jgi:Zn ribbon nucleic-acid-binding protein
VPSRKERKLSGPTDGTEKAAARETPVQRLAAAVAELVEPRQRFCYVEYYDRKLKIRVRKKHKLGRYSMLERLEADVARDDDTAPKDAGGGLVAGFKSRPPGKFVPRQLLTAFTQDLSMWLAWVGLDERNGPVDHLRGLLAIAPKMEADYPVDLANMIKDIERWTGEIRRYCGFEKIFYPRATCPHCDHFGALTVWANEETQRAERARCSHCNTGWDQISVGILLEHVIRESKKPKRVKAAKLGWQPPPPVPCPRCGQATAVSPAGDRRCTGTRAPDGSLVVASCGLAVGAA